jgi:mono/diheme cytochrome c family protein
MTAAARLERWAAAWAAVGISILGAIGGGAAGAQTPAPTAAETAPAGVENAQRAWQNWTLNCQGCHRPDGSGTEGTAPSLAGTVARFLSVPGGREYLGRVPGVATSALSNRDLAEVVNWMLWRFDREHLPAKFQPYTADEMAALRTAPLRMEATQIRAASLKKADESQTP